MLLIYMSKKLSDTLKYVAGPALAMVLGTSVGLHVHPTKFQVSIFQHMAAGIVLAALSIELIPKLLEVEVITKR